MGLRGPYVAPSWFTGGAGLGLKNTAPKIHFCFVVSFQVSQSYLSSSSSGTSFCSEKEDARFSLRFYGKKTFKSHQQHHHHEQQQPLHHQQFDPNPY